MEQLVQDAIARAERSVVAIARVKQTAAEAGQAATELIPSLPRPLEPTDPDFIPHDFGTGVVIDASGLIVTNYHVIGDPATSAHYVWSRRRPYKARVVAADPWTDLAVLQIEADGLRPVTFGDGSQVRKGQIVLALGNPHAIARDGEASASWGIVSNVLRKAPPDPRRAESAGQNDTLHHFGTLIQTDARLNFGFSGGALINLRGEMVALTVSYAAAAGYDSAAGFAIPVDEAFRRTLDSLREGRKPEFGFLGVELEPVAAPLRRAGVHGARLTTVLPATPAARGELKPGDVISHINGHPVRGNDDLIRLVSSLAPDTQAEFTVLRGDLEQARARTLKKQVVLSKKFVAALRPQIGTALARSWRGLQVDYVTASPNFKSLAHQLDASGCVQLSQVQRDSASWKAGLRAGMLITHVQRRRVRTPVEFYAAAESRAGNVRLRVVPLDGNSKLVSVPSE